MAFTGGYFNPPRAAWSTYRRGEEPPSGSSSRSRPFRPAATARSGLICGPFLSSLRIWRKLGRAREIARCKALDLIVDGAGAIDPDLSKSGIRSRSSAVSVVTSE